MNYLLEGKTSSWGTVFNLGNSAIGAGILSFPYAFQCTGLLGGTALCFVVAILELGTMNTIIRASTAHRSLVYQSLVRSALGPGAAVLLSWTIVIYLTGSCVAFMMITGDATHAFLSRYLFPHLSLPLWAVARWPSIVAPALIVIFPLAMLRNIGALATTSTLAVAAMTFTSATLTLRLFLALARGTTSDGSPIMQGVSLWNWDASTLSAIPIMVFAYQCHVQAVPIYAELTATPSLFPCAQRLGIGSSRSPLLHKCQGMSRVAAIAFLECTVMYIITGAAGYIQFPGGTKSNILSNYDIHDDLMQVVRMLVGTAAALHYPVDLHAARTALYDLACKYRGMPAVYPAPYPPIAAAAAFMFCLTVLIACWVTDLGRVFQVIGGIVASVLIFVLPGAVMVTDPSAVDVGRLGPHGDEGDSAEEALLSVQHDSSAVSPASPGADAVSPDTGAAAGVRFPPELDLQSTSYLIYPGTAQQAHMPLGALAVKLSSVQLWGITYISVGSIIMLLTVVLTVLG